MTENSSPNTPSLQWEELICQLPGVYSACVVFSADQKPQEIHVLAGTEKSSKSLVRDIQSALMARFGVNVDYHIISIAQIQQQELPRTARRLSFDGLDISTHNGALSCAVTLYDGPASFRGSATGSANTSSRRRCLAEATLDAVSTYAGGQKFFELSDTSLVNLQDRDIIVTQIDCLPNHCSLVGSAFADPNADTGVVSSVLDAINRKLAILYIKQEP